MNKPKKALRIGSCFSDVSSVFWFPHENPDAPAGINIGTSNAVAFENIDGLGISSVLRTFRSKAQNKTGTVPLSSRIFKPKLNKTLFLIEKDNFNILVLSSSELNRFQLESIEAGRIENKEDGIFCRWGLNRVELYSRGSDNHQCLKDLFNSIMAEKVVALDSKEVSSLFSDHNFDQEKGSYVLVNVDRLREKDQLDIENFANLMASQTKKMKEWDRKAKERGLKIKIFLCEGFVFIKPAPDSVLHRGTLSIKDLESFWSDHKIVLARPEFTNPDGTLILPKLSFVEKAKIFLKM